MSNLKALAYEMRERTIDIIVEGKTGHIGGDMSVMEILTELYFDQMNISPENMDDPDRDKFVMSKGHSMEAYYAVLAEKGFFPIEEVIEKFSKFGSKYIGHPNNKLPGIEMNSGSLGHGLPVCVGMALAAKMNGQGYRTYTVMAGDSLSAIGAKTGVDWKTIAALNGISSPYTVHPGQVLKLAEEPKKEDDDMDQDKFNKMFATAMQQYRQELRDNDSGEWSRAARQFAIDQGIFAGSGTATDGQPNFMWEDFLTREQCAQVLYRFAQKFGLA